MYRLVFDEGADGGPTHVLWLLRGYMVTLRKNDVVVASGTVVDSDENDWTVTVQTYTDVHRCENGPVVTVPVDSFDTVVYH